MAQVLDTLQNAGNGFVCPLAGISRRSVADRQALFVGVGRGVQDVVMLQPLGDLRRPQAVHAQGENLLHDSRRFLVHNPAFLVLRVFHVPIGRDGAKVFAGASLGLPGRLDLLAGVLGEHFIEYVSDCGKLTISLYAVHPVIYGDEVNTILREYHFTDMDKTTKNLYGVADNPGTYDGAGIFLFKLAYNFTL